MLKPDVNEIRKFFSVLSTSRNFTETLQIFSDLEKNNKFNFGKLNYLDASCYQQASDTTPAIPRKMSFRCDLKNNKQALDDLVRVNNLGYGIFFMVQNGKLDPVDKVGNCRTQSNVESIRTLFLDLDGSSLEPVKQAQIQPHLIVESSPGKYHCYWKIQNCDFENYKIYQKALALKFNGDKSVHDLPRVARVPGFWHLKNNPFLVKVLEINSSKSHSVNTLILALGLKEFIKEIKNKLAVGLPALDSLVIQTPVGERHTALMGYARKFAGEGKQIGEIEILLRGLASKMENGLEFLQNGAGNMELQKIAQAAINYQTQENVAIIKNLKEDLTEIKSNVVLVNNQESSLVLYRPEIAIENNKVITPINEINEIEQEAEPEQANEPETYNLIDYYVTARQLLKTIFNRKKFIYYNQTWFYYGGGVYKEIDLNYIRRDIRRLLHPFASEKVKLTETKLNDILKVIADELSLDSRIYFPEKYITAFDKNNYDYLNLSNGVLNLETNEFSKHNEDFLSFSQIPFDFNPSAKCDEFLKWLNSTFDYIEDDKNKIDLIASIQEFFGYSLSTKTTYHYFLLLLGASRGGKGTLIRVLSAMLGKDSVLSSNLIALSSSHGLENLTGKRIVAIEETPSKIHHLQLSGVAEFIKRITSGDLLTINPKGKRIYEIQSPAKFVLASEFELPFVDFGGGLLNRAIIIPFEKSYLGKEDPYLLDRLLAELPGILNWSIAGYKRLMVNKRITISQTSLDERESYKEDINPVESFLLEFFEFTKDDNDQLTNNQIWNVYQEAVEAKQYQEVNKTWFFKRLKTVAKGRILAGRKGNQRFWKRIKRSQTSFEIGFRKDDLRDDDLVF